LIASFKPRKLVTFMSRLAKANALRPILLLNLKPLKERLLVMMDL
jgi:hypothetical protein